MLRSAAQRAEAGAIAWVRADALRMPIRSGSIDRIHCAGALHLMPDTVGVLREWCRVLKPNGRIVVGTFVEASDARIRRLQQLSGRWSGFQFFGCASATCQAIDFAGPPPPQAKPSVSRTPHPHIPSHRFRGIFGLLRG
jgi:ubiquinone/menaquinone biosynthesis C-methylase UbiE